MCSLSLCLLGAVKKNKNSTSDDGEKSRAGHTQVTCS